MLLFSILGFMAVVMGLEGLYNLWASGHGSEERRIKERLAALSGEAFNEVALERRERQAHFAWFQTLIEPTQLGGRLTHWVKACGTSVTAGELLMLTFGLALLGLLLPALFGQPFVLGPAVGLALAALPWWRMSYLRAKRITRFEHQFPEALDLMCRAMRAGHSFQTTIKLIGEELPDPMGRDFRMLFDEINYGVPMELALTHLADRVPLPDVSYFVVVILVQRESGGNLTEMLEKISSIVRARLKLFGDVRTLSAEGRMSAVILIALPFAVAAAVNLLNPGFLSVLWTDPAGLRLVGIALFMMLIGILWMRKVIAIHV